MKRVIFKKFVEHVISKKRKMSMRAANILKLGRLKAYLILNL